MRFRTKQRKSTFKDWIDKEESAKKTEKVARVVGEIPEQCSNKKVVVSTFI